ncbi:hypothetical protein [Streptomyces sp. NPDC101115]|uniref:hypothetical protein n=1 Tax=Streptomyces sp. NPDC101115 TaxID=3366106 RepID=UPI0038038EF5
MPTSFCPWWTVKTHVDGSRCAHCQTRVPVVALSDTEQRSCRRFVEREACAGGCVLLD